MHRPWFLLCIDVFVSYCNSIACKTVLLPKSCLFWYGIVTGVSQTMSKTAETIRNFDSTYNFCIFVFAFLVKSSSGKMNFPWKFISKCLHKCWEVSAHATFWHPPNNFSKNRKIRKEENLIFSSKVSKFIETFEQFNYFFFS